MSKLWIRGVQSLGNLQRRFLACVFAITGPTIAYRVTGWGANAIYRLLDPLRIRSEAQCRAALHGKFPPEEIPRIAAKSFINRARNMTDLLLAPRLLHRATFARYGGRIPEPFLSELVDGQRRLQPTILVTAYYGSFDLLPIFLGYNGIQASAVYLPHANKSYDDFRRNIRGQSGCEMIPVDQAVSRLNQVLGGGGSVALLVDHHEEERGMAVRFLGLDAKVSRSIGLLAWRHQANVVVAALRRLDDTFRFQFVIADVIYNREAAAQSDQVEFVTLRYLRAIETVIMEDPAQYLWAYARWGEEYARRLANWPGITENEQAVRKSAIAGRIRDSESQPD